MTTARNFKPIQKVEPSDAELQAFAERRGMPTLHSTAKPTEKNVEGVSRPSEAQSDMTDPSADTTRLAFEVPHYLADQLKIRAIKDRCSTRYLILKAIQAAGFEINDADLITDGRRNRR